MVREKISESSARGLHHRDSKTRAPHSKLRVTSSGGQFDGCEQAERLDIDGFWDRDDILTLTALTIYWRPRTTSMETRAEVNSPIDARDACDSVAGLTRWLEWNVLSHVQQHNAKGNCAWNS
ncbi:unnamed protein product [Lampetra planeri]